MYRSGIYVLLYWLVCTALPAQSVRVPVGADGIPVFQLPEVVIVSPFASQRHRKQYEKMLAEQILLKRRVQKVWPLAVAFAAYFRQIHETLPQMPDAKVREAYKNILEKQLFSRYEPILRDMDIKEGGILIKLLHREAGRSAYAGIKEMKSGFAAFFWQQVALVLGNNLKAQYDPVREWQIEAIVQEMEARARK